MNAWHLMIALLIAGLLAPAPANLATVAIAAAGILLMGVQFFLSRRIAARCAELIDAQEALLAG